MVGAPDTKTTELAVGHLYCYDYKSYFPVAAQATAELKKGDRVGVKLEQGWLHEFGNGDLRFLTSFTGFLIRKCGAVGCVDPKP